MDLRKRVSRLSWKSGLAVFLAAGTGALAAVTAPAATTPTTTTGTTTTPTTSTPTPTAGSPMVGHLRVHIEAQAHNAVEGRAFHYEVIAHNSGPGVVTDARLDVNLPRDFELDRVGSRDQQKRTLIRSNGRIRWWAIPELRAGEDVFLILDGHFNLHDRSQSGNTFVAAAQLISPTSGQDTRRALTNVFRRR